MTKGAGLSSPGSRRGLDHQPRQKVPRDAGATASPALDLASAATAGIGGRHLAGAASGRLRDPRLLQREGVRGGAQCPGETFRETEVPAGSLKLAWMVPQFPLLRGPGTEAAAPTLPCPWLALWVRTCPAAASPAPPASAPASRPRRAGSRIPMGARGAHTDRTGPRAACQACPSRAGGGRLAGPRHAGLQPPGPRSRGSAPKPIPNVGLLGSAVRLFPRLG